MVFITAELYENAGVDVIKDNENYFWVKISCSGWIRHKKYERCSKKTNARHF